MFASSLLPSSVIPSSSLDTPTLYWYTTVASYTVFSDSKGDCFITVFCIDYVALHAIHTWHASPNIIACHYTIVAPNYNGSNRL